MVGKEIIGFYGRVLVAMEIQVLSSGVYNNYPQTIISAYRIQTEGENLVMIKPRKLMAAMEVYWLLWRQNVVKWHADIYGCHEN